LEIERLRRLRATLADKGMDGLVVSNPQNLRYLSGFTGSSGWLLISENKAILATDFRYIEQAKMEAPDYEISLIKGDLSNWLPNLISDLNWQKLAFEDTSVSYHSYRMLSDTVKSKLVNLELVPSGGLVEQLRSIKEPEELELIKRAVELTDAAFEQAKLIIRPGVTEKEVAWELEKLLRDNGSEQLAFDIILASGPNSALPHAKPTERAICAGEPVLIDMGAKIGGYCGDFSRTLCCGQADKTLQEIYGVVLQAQTAAMSGIESGIGASQADALARTVIEQAGYGDAFGHSLGHGIGLSVHELPTLAPNSSDLLIDDMVFTVEPGIYISGWGGVRIEDIAILEKGRIKMLTRSEKTYGGII
jgi:Xaa-Pro aminopeptidase